MAPHVEWIGFAAGSLTTISFAPQVVKTWRTGGRDLSWLMLATFATGVTLWFVYGWQSGSRPVVWANGLTDVQVLALLVMKLWRKEA